MSGCAQHKGYSGAPPFGTPCTPDANISGCAQHTCVQAQGPRSRATAQHIGRRPMVQRTLGSRRDHWANHSPGGRIRAGISARSALVFVRRCELRAMHARKVPSGPQEQGRNGVRVNLFARPSAQVCEHHRSSTDMR